MQKTFQLLICLICYSVSVNAQKAFDCDQLKKSMLETQAMIDSLRTSGKLSTDSNYVNRIDSLNATLINCIKLLAIDDRFQKCELNSHFNFKSLISSDKRFCITSWDTRLGGTMIDYTNVVIYKTFNKTFVKQLVYGEPGFKDNSKIMFDTLFSIQNNKGQTIYITYGSGYGSTALPFSVVKAFMITDSLIENSIIFPNEIDSLAFNDPNNSGELSIEYDLHNFKGNDKVHEMKFLNGGLEIKVPIIKANGRPSNRYYSLVFNGERYIKKE